MHQVQQVVEVGRRGDALGNLVHDLALEFAFLRRA